MLLTHFLPRLLTLLTLFSVTISATSKSKPIHKCEQSSSTCVFSYVYRFLNDYEWEPTAERPEIVTYIYFKQASNRIAVATKDICETFPILRQLHMNNLEMQEIKEDAFHACKELRTLRLDENKLKVIPSTTFKYTTNLDTLVLNDNQIASLDDDIFVNLPKLREVILYRNYLTEFSSKIIRNNSELRTLELYSNDLSDIEAEYIRKTHPNLFIFLLNHNEMSCSRVVEINEALTGLVLGGGKEGFKKRYYPQEIIDYLFVCNPDISWMASTFRKQNAIIQERFHSLETQIVNKCENSEKDQKMHKIEERLEKLEDKIDRLIDLALKSGQK